MAGVSVRFPLTGARRRRQTGRVLDPDHCYRLLQTRDRRFDGWFVTAVRTTGIYCRPSCPAVMPKRRNVEFYPTAATAQQHGYRACKRCRPDASPGSPAWDTRGDVVARAMRLVADGVVDRDGVPGLAKRFGYSERHLNRVMTDELGAGPLAIARAQRAHTARTLLETTDMALPAVADASGFGSIRQFNDTVREVFASTPTALRQARRSAAPGPAGTVDLQLPVREPFAADELVAFFAARAIPGVEHWDGHRFHRALALPRGHGVAVLTPDQPSTARWAPRRRSAAPPRRLAGPRCGRAPDPPPAGPRRRPGVRRRGPRRRRGTGAVGRRHAQAGACRAASTSSRPRSAP